MNRGYNSDSSDALGFHNNKVWSQTASAPDEPRVRVEVHLMLAFKLDKDVFGDLLQHKMNRRYTSYHRFIRCLCLNWTEMH
jgi:hypothetical protein